MNEMKKLVEELNEAAKVYYSEGENLMTDKAYDEAYDHLKAMEQAKGIVLPDSPTQRIGYDVVSELKKVEHAYPARSLDKTKDLETLKQWLGDSIGALSWKMDGLTAIATWEDGRLVQLATRGNGFIGEDVTHNAPYIKGLPLAIPEKGTVIVRGEVVIDYPQFRRINASIEDANERYKNPRNLATSSLRLTEKTKARNRGMVCKGYRRKYGMYPKYYD